MARCQQAQTIAVGGTPEISHFKGLILDINRYQVLDIELEELEELIHKHLTKDVYSRDELMRFFHISSHEFEEKLLTANTIHATEFKVPSPEKRCFFLSLTCFFVFFKLRQRALHVVQGLCLV